MSTAEQIPGAAGIPEPPKPAPDKAAQVQKPARPSLLALVWRRARRNFGLKILSLLIAIGLWSFVNAGQRSAIESMQVPVSYRGLARGLVIVNRPVDFVKIQVMGPRTLLSLLDPERLTVKLDLASIGPGQASFKITPAMFDVPRQTTVTSVSPSDVMLDVDRIVRRDVPVRLTLEGTVAKGYAVQAMEVQPHTVRVIGPSRYVDALEAIRSDPIDVTGAVADVDRVVGLVSPTDPGVILSMVKAEAKINVVQKVTDREFRNLDLQVKDTGYKYRIKPKTGSVTLHGPELKLEQLSSDGLLYVEAKDLGPGVHFIPVQVNLPDGIELVRQSPQKVKLTIYREKTSRKQTDEHASQVVRH